MKLQHLFKWFLNLFRMTDTMTSDSSPKGKSRQAIYQQQQVAKGLCRYCRNPLSKFSNNYCDKHLKVVRGRIHEGNRKRAGIPLDKPKRKTKPLREDEWKDDEFFEMLGQDTDVNIAALYGVAYQTIRYHRLKLDIPRYVKPHRR